MAITIPMTAASAAGMGFLGWIELLTMTPTTPRPTHHGQDVSNDRASRARVIGRE
jgi:hypothetical protein